MKQYKYNIKFEISINKIPDEHHKKVKHIFQINLSEYIEDTLYQILDLKNGFTHNDLIVDINLSDGVIDVDHSIKSNLHNVDKLKTIMNVSAYQSVFNTFFQIITKQLNVEQSILLKIGEIEYCVSEYQDLNDSSSDTDSSFGFISETDSDK